MRLTGTVILYRYRHGQNIHFHGTLVLSTLSLHIHFVKTVVPLGWGEQGYRDSEG